MVLKENVSNLVIVGNGLDLHHGLQTNYQDFKLSGMSVVTLQKFNNLVNEISGGVDYKDWYNFEETYRQIILYKISQLVDKGGLNESNADWFANEIEGVNQLFHRIMHELKEYLESIPKENKYYVIDENVQSVLQTADAILTFNYTDTLESLYRIPDNKIIHAHGSLKTFPIFGHSNFIMIGEDTNYGFIYGEQGISDMMRSDKVTRIDARTGVVTEGKRGAFKSNISNGSNQMFGDKNIQRLFMMLINQKSKIEFINFSQLNEVYKNPFNEFSFDLKNELALNFDKSIKITVIGHGLGSDIDLLNKINAQKKFIQIFNGPSFCDRNAVNKARDVFSSLSENTVEVDYSW